MCGLIQADLPPTRKSDFRHGTPSGFFNLRADNAFLKKSVHFGSKVIAHEIELMETILICGVNGQFRRGKHEDEPIVAGIHRRKFKYVTKERSVCGSIRAVHNDVSAVYHGSAPSLIWKISPRACHIGSPRTSLLAGWRWSKRSADQTHHFDEERCVASVCAKELCNESEFLPATSSNRKARFVTMCAQHRAL